MVRPRIELPAYIVGGVDDYATREELERDEAWKEVLLTGLEVKQVEGFYNDQTDNE